MKLEVKNISVSIAGKKIIKNVSPLFPEGRCIAIIGANGAGKSTLLRVLAALHPEYEGEVLLGGENLREISRKKIARQLAILPQTMQIPPDITVERLIDYGRFPYRSLFGGGNPKEDKEATDWAISVVNLENFKNYRRIRCSLRRIGVGLSIRRINKYVEGTEHGDGTFVPNHSSLPSFR